VRVPGRKAIRKFAGWLRGRFVNGALILGYHRITEAAQDPFGMCVSPGHFERHLEVLCRYAHPTRLQTIAGGLHDGNWPRRSVVLTFDDGYADLLEIELLLARYQVPATVFVATGAMGSEFWWDELQRITLSPDTLLRHLVLHIGDSTWSWTPELVRTARHADRRSDLRPSLLQALYRLLSPLQPATRQHAMDQLRDWAGTGKEGSPSSRALTDVELIKLANGDWIEIGAHSVTHASLAALPISAQQKEIEESKGCLEALLGRGVAAFSYPNGSSSAETRELVRGAGYAYACASQNDVVWRGSDRFELPRFWIPDWDEAAFARWLRQWLES
jgi:peptidoglycan/xylan/chitin deacetylase (PgdA/CDA1 family)